MKILIIKQGALGDVVIATPLIKAILTAHPDCEIFLLTTPAFAPIFAAWEKLSVHAFERRGLKVMIDLVKFVRGGRFDRIYDLQGTDRTGLLCALSASNERIGIHTRYPYTHHPIAKWSGQTHIFEWMKRVLKSASVEVLHEVPILPTTALNRTKVDKWLTENTRSDSRLVALHASASAERTEKCWPHFNALAKKLCAGGFTPLWLGSVNDREQNESNAKRSGGKNISGLFDIPELAYLAESLQFAVTNDSGPMHVLAAAKIPIYGLFGPSNWRRNHALGQAEHVIHSPHVGDSIGTITVNMVWQRLIADRLVS